MGISSLGNRVRYIERDTVDMQPYASHFDPLAVTLATTVAAFASSVALDLVRRMESGDRRLARRWWLGGSSARP